MLSQAEEFLLCMGERHGYVLTFKHQPLVITLAERKKQIFKVFRETVLLEFLEVGNDPRESYTRESY